jgi:hypothetical protein
VLVLLIGMVLRRVRLARPPLAAAEVFMAPYRSRFTGAQDQTGFAFATDPSAIIAGRQFLALGDGMSVSGLRRVSGRSKTAIAAAGAFVLAIALLVSMAGAPDAGAAKLTACVNKKTGNMRLVSGKKAKRPCPRGWRKVTWEKGKGSPGYKVYSADGRLLGGLLSSGPLGGGGLTVYTILRNGGVYFYFPSGQLLPTSLLSGSGLTFKTSDCTGSAYAALGGGPLPPGIVTFYEGLFGSPYRAVYRSSSGPSDFGPSRAWKYSGNEAAVAPVDLYELNSGGTCVLDQAGFTGTLFAFTPTPAPPDFKGPLRIR